MRLRLFQVDAFTSELFGGNPAAVIPLERWLPDRVLQSIAAENNLPETAFFVPEGDGYHLRWMTPTEEVDFCGHATLASAFVLLTELRKGATEIRFRAQCGPLAVRREEGLFVMDAPNWEPRPIEPPPLLLSALGRAPAQILAARDYVAVFESEDEIRSYKPDFAALAKVDRLGVAITAPGRRADFVSRFFTPGYGVPEDPVTGSAHAELAPYWGRRLGKRKLHAQQLSARGGELFCEVLGDRVNIAGRAVKYLDGWVELPDALAATGAR